MERFNGLSFGALHLVIIGGGFCGTMVALNLARTSGTALRVTVINCGRPMGRGIAYGTTRSEHLLNVAARNMSAFPEHPNHFVEWLQTRTEFAGVPEAELRERFIPRRVYGDYLRGLALHFTHPVTAGPRVAIEWLEAEVVDIEARARRGRVLLADGRTLEADKVLLATGNEPPANLPGSEKVAGHPAWCANPWSDWETRLPPDGDVVLLGTGLTAVDSLLTLLAVGWNGKIHAISRNGLLPQSHFKGIDDPEFPPAGVDVESLGLGELVELIESHCLRLRNAGHNPAMVVDKLRPHSQRIWQGFELAERRQFIARYAARWNVVRHRIAPSVHQQVTQALESGKLHVVRASITGIAPANTKIAVNLRDGEGAPFALEAGLAINCTGPHTRFSATRSTLLRNLLRRGLVSADDLDMGLRVHSDFAVVDGAGERSPFLFAIGPLLRGTLWETIAVPELRGQAWQVAQSLLGSSPIFPTETDEVVLEYQI